MAKSHLLIAQEALRGLVLGVNVMSLNPAEMTMYAFEQENMTQS